MLIMMEGLVLWMQVHWKCASGYHFLSYRPLVSCVTTKLDLSQQLKDENLHLSTLSPLLVFSGQIPFAFEVP